MLYIKRDTAGKIIALSAEPNGSTVEQAHLESPEVMDFLETSDLDLIRVLEDLIDVLLEKNLIRFTDLPATAQRKLLSRRTARDHLQDKASLLLNEDDIL